MESGFYPYSGPAGKDDPSKPYPKWYYQNTGGAGVTAHSVEEFFYAVDAGYRALFGGRFSDDKPKLWYLGVKDEKSPVLPRIAKEQANEQEQIARLIRELNMTGDQPYAQTLMQMYEKGLPTRLIEWTQNAIYALKNALIGGEPGSVAVWCLSPANLNRMLCGCPFSVPGLLDEAAVSLFGNYGTAGINKPFAVTAGPSSFVVFPRRNICALEEQQGSVVYLTKISIPSAACILIREQLRRYGL